MNKSSGKQKENIKSEGMGQWEEAAAQSLREEMIMMSPETILRLPKSETDASTDQNMISFT